MIGKISTGKISAEIQCVTPARKKKQMGEPSTIEKNPRDHFPAKWLELAHKKQ
jgi:hypothetical protein